MKKTITILLSLLVSFNYINAQVVVRIAKNYDSNSGSQNGTSLSKAKNGGYVLCGTNDNPGFQKDIYFIRIDDNTGGEVWNQNFNVVNQFAGNNSNETGNQIITNPDGSYTMVGSTAGLLGELQQALVVNTQIDTNLINWSKLYGIVDKDTSAVWPNPPSDSLTMGAAIKRTSDGGYIIAGTTFSEGSGIPFYSNIYVVKTDANGTVQWTNTYGGPDNDMATDIEIAADGNYIVSGQFQTSQFTPRDGYLIKIDATTHNTIWTKNIIMSDKYGDAGSGDCIVTDVDELPDGSLIIGGGVTIVVSGITHPATFVARVNSGDGSIIQKDTLCVAGECEQFTLSDIVYDQRDKSYIIAGRLNNDFLVLKEDSNITASGNKVLWYKTFDPAGAGKDDEAKSIMIDDSGYYCIAGSATFNNGSFDHLDFYFVQIADTTIKTGGGVGFLEKERGVNNVSVFPNPFSRTASVIVDAVSPSETNNVDFAVYDVLGQKMNVSPVFTLTPKGTEIKIDRNNLSTGVYFFKVKTGQQSLGSGKLVVTE